MRGGVCVDSKTTVDCVQTRGEERARDRRPLVEAFLPIRAYRTCQHTSASCLRANDATEPRLYRTIRLAATVFKKSTRCDKVCMETKTEVTTHRKARILVSIRMSEQILRSHKYLQRRRAMQQQSPIGHSPPSFTMRSMLAFVVLVSVLVMSAAPSATAVVLPRGESR